MNKDSRSLLDTTNEIIDDDTRQIGIQAGLDSDSDGENLENVGIVGETTNIESTTSSKQ